MYLEVRSNTITNFGLWEMFRCQLSAQNCDRFERRSSDGSAPRYRPRPSGTGHYLQGGGLPNGGEGGNEVLSLPKKEGGADFILAMLKGVGPQQVLG